jgi:hypothetical protein
LARVVLTVFVVGLAVPVLAAGHGPAEDDTFCAPFLPSAGHPTLQFEQVLPPVTGEHCAICHWLRAVSGAAPDASSPTQALLDAVSSIAPMPELAGGRTILAERPSRAPPVLVR